jgi:hypothetical protein
MNAVRMMLVFAVHTLLMKIDPPAQRAHAQYVEAPSLMTGALLFFYILQHLLVIFFGIICFTCARKFLF